MIDFLRSVKRGFYAVSSYQIGGFQIDTALHFIIGCVMILVLCRFFSRKKSLSIAFGLIILKEVVDVFAKSRADYIRPPHLDLLFDVAAGTLGVLAGLWILKRRREKHPLPGGTDSARR
jgi:hypothetical protein